jgi:sterol desaturase/sphingolipid hydroxylase (fatty acid hydroxylase superfamily)
MSVYTGLSPLTAATLLLLQVPLAFVGRVLAAALEWTIHRYVFHGLGKRKGSIFAFHWREHHRACRKVEMRDDPYVHGSLLDSSNGHFREFWPLVLVSASLLPFALVVPGLVAGLIYGGWRYHLLHRKSHLNPEWAKEHLRWHYDHHMAPNQETNWGVSNEWFDRWMGTRVEWEGPKRARHRRVHDAEEQHAAK